jgi:hypothetical protein
MELGTLHTYSRRPAGHGAAQRLIRDRVAAWLPLFKMHSMDHIYRVDIEIIASESVKAVKVKAVERSRQEE